MTLVTIYKKDGKIIGYDAIGHADDQAEYGTDLACAAISVLAINTENAIEILTDDSFVSEADDQTGYIKVMMTEEVSRDSSVLLNAFEIGVTSISEAYGRDYIQIRFEEV